MLSVLALVGILPNVSCSSCSSSRQEWIRPTLAGFESLSTGKGWRSQRSLWMAPGRVQLRREQRLHRQLVSLQGGGLRLQGPQKVIPMMKIQTRAFGVFRAFLDDQNKTLSSSDIHECIGKVWREAAKHEDRDHSSIL